MLKGLFLDDERNPEDVTWLEYPDDITWTTVRNYNEFLVYFEYYGWDIISLDHDIQDFKDGEEKTGYDCIKHIVNDTLLSENPFYLLDLNVYVHSKNPIGNKNITEYFDRAIKFIKDNKDYDEKI